MVASCDTCDEYRLYLTNMRMVIRSGGVTSQRRWVLARTFRRLYRDWERHLSEAR
ncbi:MAG: hypothetical protein HYX99_03570 [Chloroflexi bacterium]|nr:hypothetical protein [Chloroflexota bacterium]